MKQLLTLSMLLAALLLAPAVAFGQFVYTASFIWYEQDSNTVYGSAFMSTDYATFGYYTPVLSANIVANNDTVAWGSAHSYPYMDVYLSTPGQQNTNYYIYAYSLVVAYYAYYVPFTYEYWFYDPYNYYTWGGSCQDFQFILCTGEGPPVWIIEIMVYVVGEVWDMIYVPPPCPTDEVSILTAHIGFDYGSLHYRGGYFDAQLKDNYQIPPSGKYANRTVTESFDMLQDGCQNTYGGPFTLGYPDTSSWTVNNDNKYTNDIVAAARYWIDYYVGQHVSCSGTLKQIMSISGCGVTPVEYERHDCEHKIQGVPPQHNYNPKRGGVGVPEDWPWNN